MSVSVTLRANMAQGCRLDVLEDQECWVFPVIMMIEGVHSGSGGPILYREQDLSKCPQTWNSKPVVIRHPIEGGEPVSGSTPKAFNTTKIGTLFNTKWEDGKLKAEAWCPKALLEDRAPEVLREIDVGEILEVSTGLFFDLMEESGDFNGETYYAIATNLQPDHLAILPDEIGACSIQDGAGIPRLNAASGVQPLPSHPWPGLPRQNRAQTPQTTANVDEAIEPLPSACTDTPTHSQAANSRVAPLPMP